MKGFYGLQWYLALTHARHGQWVVIALATLVGLAVAWRWWRLRQRKEERLRVLCDMGPPVGCLALGLALLCLPGWRGLDGFLNETEQALLSGFFHVRDNATGGSMPVGYGRVAGSGRRPMAHTPPTPGAEPALPVPPSLVWVGQPFPVMPEVPAVGGEVTTPSRVNGVDGTEQRGQ